MTVKVPHFPDVPGLSDFLTKQFEAMEQRQIHMLSARTANHSLLLETPTHKVYEVTVDDLGALVVTLVAG